MAETNQPKKKSSGYLEAALKEVSQIIDQAKDRDEAVAKVKDLLQRKLLESFKNGMTVGLKKAGKAK
jgi:hypothetical protein